MRLNQGSNWAALAVVFFYLSEYLLINASPAEDPPPISGDDYLDDLETNFNLYQRNSNKNHKVIYKREKRQSGGGASRYLACEMLIAIDEPLYVHYQRNLENVTTLVTDLVDRMNQIYANTVLRGEFAHLYFRIKEIRILYDFCTECNQTQRVYLTEFSKTDYSDFCLAHIFTYRDFPEGVQGLAWKGTLCRSAFNTGFTTLVNHQVEATVKDSALTLAHEVGHNFGSDHDEDRGCDSSYIMSESGSSSIEAGFSSCSYQDITKLLRDIINNPKKNCFVYKQESDPPDFSVCGNGVVEGDEECDCGMSYHTCGDPCCYAASIHPNDLFHNKSATPCRTNRKHICLEPFDSSWQYGIVAPWIFILVASLIFAIGLLWDWKHEKHLYRHVTKPKEMIRSETEEQMTKRLNRQSSKGQNVYVIEKVGISAVSNGIHNHNSVNLRPEQPHTGLVKQMKERLEKRNSEK